ncbi:mechanosensitive ion channel domain-containing protein [Pseudahrensia aquimaris]|uniref:Mechanosensitive ion channel domain-containing protein n=1 Tax=Pseudahrensia aquimaris TaxID=744461 RepID=A0ABW3FFE5_9HYPH
MNTPFRRSTFWFASHYAAAIGIALIALAMTFSPAYAQTEAPLVETVPEQLEQLNRTTDFIERVINSAEGDDDTLIGARSKLLDQRPAIDGVMKPVQDRLSQLNEAITKIGAPPEDGSAEDQLVSEERQRLTNERSELLVLTTRRDDLLNRISRNVDRIAQLRREAFAQALTQRTPISTETFSSLGSDIDQAAFRVWNTVSNWFTGLLNSNPSKLALAAFLAFALAGSFRWFVRNVIRHDMPEYPSKLFLLSNALVKTLIPTLVMGIAAFVFVGVLTAFELYPATVGRILTPIMLATVSYFFIVALASAVFSPDSDKMRLVPFSSHAASRISFLIVILAAVQVLDYVVSSLATAVSAQLTVTLVNSFIAAMLIGLILLALMLVRKDKDVAQRAIPRWLRVPILLISLTIFSVALSGYIGLSRFIAQQIVISGAIVVTIYIGISASRELGEPGNFANTRFGHWLATHRGVLADRMDQYGLLISLSMMAVTLLVGIPALAMQWGSRIDDIWTFVKQLFFGFSIGSFTFSLGNILFGIGVFVLIFFITRLFQRWLSRSVLSRTRADIGVRNSITTGVGYTGIAIACLMGVTAAGFNLASLAIVAGALSLGIGFGLQNVVSNFVSGLILLVERPIKVGDFIETGSHTGTIKKISVRATELETIHRMSVIVPNSELINSSVGNWTHKMKNGRIDIAIGVAYGTDYKLVRELLLEVGSRPPEVMKEPAPFVNFVGFGESSVDFELRVHLRDWTQFPIIRSEMLFDICEIFGEHEIEIPFPQRDLNIRSIDDDVVKSLGGKPPTKKPKPAPRRKKAEDEA